MQKIISLFQRNYDGDRLVRDEVTTGAEWVLAGEGTATRKWDGTCCLVREGRLYKRYEVKPGKSPPADFEPACEVDLVTGKQQGWRPVGDGPDDAAHLEAWVATLLGENVITPAHSAGPAQHEWQATAFQHVPDGTYELCGPKVQGNPEGLAAHVLIRHGQHPVEAPRSFAALRDWLATAGIEGVVWHHPDGRMVKIKAKDFGHTRTP